MAEPAGSRISPPPIAPAPAPAAPLRAPVERLTAPTEPSPDPPDRIELRGLRLLGAHGAAAGEEALAQPFEVDLDVFADLSRAGRSDQLAHTADYGALCEAVRTVIEGPHVALLEHLAEKVARAVMVAGGPVVSGVGVAVRKLRPPVPFQLASAGVSVYRSAPAPTRAFVALGSNLGDRWANLRRGVAGLPDVVAISPVYETEPVGGPAGQGRYLNMVAELMTRRSPSELLAAAQQAEAAALRQRGERWGPRTLDVDILLYGEEKIATPDLLVPHPRMWERGFVLAPLADLAPELVAGKLGAELLEGVRMAGTLSRAAAAPVPTGAGEAAAT